MAALRERGWTPVMVRDFLGEPDDTRPNPRYRSAAPMRLWTLAKVEAAEASREFGGRKAEAEARSAAGKARAAEKAQELAERVSSIEVNVPRLPRADLIRRACDSYNAWSQDFRATPGSSPEFLDRICVNYLRHELTDYERALESLYGQVGRADARDIIREKVYNAIADAYPDLAAECRRQELTRSAYPM
jgi:hypothetical protein